MKAFFSRLAVLALASAPAFAGILPGVIGTWKQTSTAPVETKADKALWDEYGLQEAEQGVFENAGRKMTVTSWRLADSTASRAAFEFIRPPDAKPGPDFAELSPVAARTSDGAIVALGNYLVRFEGAVPDATAAANMFRSMPRFERSGLPTFVDYLPQGAIPNSERYIGGPVALKQFYPEIQASDAAFSLGAEAAVADYKAGRLALFSYPTPAIARERTEALRKTPGAAVKRAGPLVAVVLHSPHANAAEALLAKVRWGASVTTGEKPSSKKDNPGNLLLNVFYLVLILAGFCIASGVLFGLLRIALRRGGASGDGEELLTLHLEQR
jgi:hypothetical protein